MRRILFALTLLLAPMAANAVPLTTQVPATLQLTTCASHIPVAGSGSGNPQVCDTLTAMLDSAFSSTQGALLYRNSTVWTALAPGTNGFFLETQGAGANLIWAAAAGGSGCTIAGGAQFQIVVNNGASGCSSSPSATVNVGALALGASGTLGSITMGNATSGTILLQPVTGALGSVTLSLPATTGTLVCDGCTQTLTNKSIAGSEINSGTVGFTFLPTYVRAMTVATAAMSFGGI